MRKISIVTLWNAMNYGAFLQAYAIGEFCRNLGFEVNYIEECKEERNFLWPISKDFKKMLYQLKLQDNFNKSLTLFKESSLKDYSHITIIGSDEVWNVSNKHFKHLDIYVGKNLNSDIIFSYAACSNGAEISEFYKCYGENPFEKFRYISVRDEITKKMVDEIINKDIAKVVLDPTFLISNYDEILCEYTYRNYILIYGYYFSEDEINQIKEFACDKKMKMISAGTYLYWTDKQIPASPMEFLGLLKNAKYVITSTFHGTVFSIIFNKEFVSFARNNKKILEILSDMNLNNRNGSLKNILDIFDNRINFDFVNSIVDKKRKFSIDFLLGALNKNDK